MGVATYRFLKSKVITEATTDVAINFLTEKIKIKWIPFGGAIVGKVLDNMLPEKLLEMLKYLMIRVGMATQSDFIENNPFK